MITRIITLLRECVTSLTAFVSIMHFHVELMFILKAIKCCFNWSYDKRNLRFLRVFIPTLIRVVISYEIYEVSFYKFHMK